MRNSIERSKTQPLREFGTLQQLPNCIRQAYDRLASKHQNGFRFVELRRPGRRSGRWCEVDKLDASHGDDLRTTIEWHTERAKAGIAKCFAGASQRVARRAAEHILRARIWAEVWQGILNPDWKYSEAEMPFPILEVDEAAERGQSGLRIFSPAAGATTRKDNR